MTPTTICAGCKIDYPEGLLAPYFEGAGIYTPLCGICALARVNAAHGQQWTQFYGGLAEDLRQQAQAHRFKLDLASRKQAWMLNGKPKVKP